MDRESTNKHMIYADAQETKCPNCGEEVIVYIKIGIDVKWLRRDVSNAE